MTAKNTKKTKVISIEKDFVKGVDEEENKEQITTVLNLFGKKINIPESWDDINKDYLLAYVESIRLGVNPEGILPFVLIQANGIEKLLKENISIEGEKEKENILAEVYRASETLAFLLEENQLSFGIIDNIDGLFTPKKGLSDFKMLEYVVANQFIQSFAQRKKIQDLDALCATILRNRSKGIRIPFSEAEHEFMLKQVKTISLTTKLAIAKMYEGEILRLSKLYPLCFTGNGNSKSFPYDLITSVAGDKFGNVAQVEQTDIHIILQYIEKTIAENEKNKSNELE